MADDDNFDAPDNPDELNGGNADDFDQNGSEDEFDGEQSRPASDRPLRPTMNANGQLVLPGTEDLNDTWHSVRVKQWKMLQLIPFAIPVSALIGALYWGIKVLTIHG